MNGAANGDARKRHHLVRRLRKATFYAGQLENLCKSKVAMVDGRMALDVQVRRGPFEVGRRV